LIVGLLSRKPKAGQSFLAKICRDNYLPDHYCGALSDGLLVYFGKKHDISLEEIEAKKEIYRPQISLDSQELRAIEPDMLWRMTLLVATMTPRVLGKMGHLEFAQMAADTPLDTLLSVQNKLILGGIKLIPDGQICLRIAQEHGGVFGEINIKTVNWTSRLQRLGMEVPDYMGDAVENERRAVYAQLKAMLESAGFPVHQLDNNTDIGQEGSSILADLELMVSQARKPAVA
jgi:hypothetical protein